MPTYTLRGRITEDRRLEVEVPPDAPVGEAEVVVTVANAGEPELGSGEALLALARKWDKEPPVGRTAEEIEVYIAETRASWD